MEFVIAHNTPDWPAPARVRACSTVRMGGVSLRPYDSMNLGDHTGDTAHAVTENRKRLRTALRLPSEPVWLRQIHGARVIEALPANSGISADASFSTHPGAVCAVLTADCLPVLFCDRAGTRAAAAHAGWRGLAAGILEAVLARLALPPQEVLVWLGPAISAHAFEVGQEVREAFMKQHVQAQSAFTATRPGYWLADLYELARLRLARQGIAAVYGGEYCTYSQPEHFFSYRRDTVTGRMATLIWLE
ncbi:MAG: peptidoglycan editing factor PgeF [Gammaproteobacteria bacterium]|nr:peptidoglycan editing factor PgeF [Gammaproteobacteria bacterium]